MIRYIAGFLTDLLLYLPLFILSITCHEFAHAWVANRLGDPTAREAGRLSLNPLRHLDLLGTLLLVFVHFGWAKPVPVDPRYFARPRLQMIFVSVAGPAANFLLALLCIKGLLLVTPAPDSLTYALMWVMVKLNIMLLVFNLIPLPPLDGSSVLRSILPLRLLAHYDRMAPYSILLLFVAFSTTPVQRVFGTMMELVLRALVRILT